MSSVQVTIDVDLDDILYEGGNEVLEYLITGVSLEVALKALIDYHGSEDVFDVLEDQTGNKVKEYFNQEELKTIYMLMIESGFERVGEYNEIFEKLKELL
jgi:hypothetical protein